MKEGFNPERAAEMKNEELKKLGVLISELSEKWGANDVNKFLENFVESERLKKAREIHETFGSLPK